MTEAPPKATIDWGAQPANLPLSKEECINECTKEGGYFESVEINFGPYDQADIDRCLKSLFDNGYATCGRVRETTESRTNKLIQELRKKYRFVRFTLKHTRTDNVAAECQLKGWDQGKDQSDCWIDSFLFALFANNEMSGVFMDKLTKLYNDTDYTTDESVAWSPETKALNNALFFMDLYLNFLTNRSGLLKDNDPKNIKNYTKWCLVWSILTYFKLTEPPEIYDSIQNAISLNEIDMTIPAGGNYYILSYFLGKVIPGHVYRSHSLYPLVYKNVKDIADQIGSLTIPIQKEKYFYAIPMTTLTATNNENKYNKTPFGEEGDSRKALKRLVSLERLKKNTLNLEAIVLGQGTHQVSLTKCGPNWRFYNNQAAETTIPLESLSRVAEKIDKYLTNKSKTQTALLFVYRVSKSLYGGTRKQKSPRQNRKQTRKHR